MTLTERALKLRYDAGRAMGAPSAFLLPPHVRQLIEDQTALLADLAATIEGKTQNVELTGHCRREEKPNE